MLVIMVALIFAFSSYYTASESFDSLGPTITSDQYQELIKIKQDYLNNPNSVIVAGDFQTKYWVQYVLGNNVTISEDQNEIKTIHQPHHIRRNGHWKQPDPGRVPKK